LLLGLLCFFLSSLTLARGEVVPDVLSFLLHALKLCLTLFVSKWRIDELIPATLIDPLTFEFKPLLKEDLLPCLSFLVAQFDGLAFEHALSSRFGLHPNVVLSSFGARVEQLESILEHGFLDFVI
jgi:hypothetical protein